MDCYGIDTGKPVFFTGHILAFSRDLQPRTKSDSSPLPLPWIPSSNSDHHIETIYSSDSEGIHLLSSKKKKSFVCEVVFLQMNLVQLSFGILRRG